MKKATDKMQFDPADAKFIFDALRRATTVWKGRTECLNRSRKKVLVGRTKSGKAIHKYHWQCAACLEWYADINSLEVDHIEEIGGITAFTGDWNETISRIFPRPVSEKLQALCLACHAKKTQAYCAANQKWKRKKKAED